jgi:hypothetical protein
MNPPSAELVELVAKRNAFNSLVNLKIETALRVFTPLVGTKIKAISQGDFTAKVKGLIESSSVEQRDDNANFRSYVQFEYTSLYLKVGFGNDFREEVCIGNITNEGVLRDVYPRERILRKTDYNAEKISHANQKIAMLEEEIRQLRSDSVSHIFRNGIV